MIRMIAWRLAQLPVILLVIYTAVLTLAWAVPGNPLENPEGRQPPPAVQEALKRQYNLDRFDRFYTSYLYNVTGAKWAVETLDGTADDAARTAAAAGEAAPPRYIFNFGPSLQYRDQNVNEIIGSSLPISVTLGFAAILIAVVVGVGAGIIGAVKPNSIADLATLLVALIGISLPNFVVGTVLLLGFGIAIPLIPVAEWGTIRGMIAPALTLSLPFAAYIARLTRLGMIEQLSSDHIRTARAKGAAELSVLIRHALKNAFLPVLSYLGPATAFAMTGSFVVEEVFSVPGIGQHFVNGVQNKDLFLLIGVVLVFATMLILFNLIVDVLYRWVDPRITD
ncbi:MAG: ABC transporter permease [Planctomycetota bacterium]